jgi:hypothetical protein
MESTQSHHPRGSHGRRRRGCSRPSGLFHKRCRKLSRRGLLNMHYKWGIIWGKCNILLYTAPTPITVRGPSSRDSARESACKAITGAAKPNAPQYVHGEGVYIVRLCVGLLYYLLHGSYLLFFEKKSAKKATALSRYSCRFKSSIKRCSTDQMTCPAGAWAASS